MKNKHIIIAVIFIPLIVIMAIILPSILFSDNQVSQNHVQNAPLPGETIVKNMEPPQNQGLMPEKQKDNSNTDSQETFMNDNMVQQNTGERFIIQDYLGIPISSGKIKQATAVFDFQNGEFFWPSNFNTAEEFEVLSEGYISKICNYKDISSKDIILEYCTNYEIGVQDSSNNPAKEVTVKVWKMLDAVRPPHEIITPIFVSRSDQTSLKRDETGFIFTENSTNNIQFYRIRPNGFGEPRIGDQVVNMTGSNWSEQFPEFYNERVDHAYFDYLSLLEGNSSQLRIWDTFSLLSESSPNLRKSTGFNTEVNFLKFEFIRNSRIGFSILRLPILEKGKAVFIKELITDTKGKCVIKDLPPALYYVQAIQGILTSNIVPLFPSCGGINLRLQNSSDFSLYVYREVKNDKENNGQKIPVVDADILIKSKNENRVYSVKTDSSGLAIQKNIPYGDYEVTVSAPSIIREGQKKFSFKVCKPKEFLEIALQDWLTYKISGTVLENKTKTPVPDYWLSLYQEDKLISVQNSTKNGQFEFTNLIAGQYSLCGYIKEEKDIHFLPNAINDSFLYYTMDKAGPFGDTMFSYKEKIIIENQDVVNHVFLVKEVSLTKFSGKVIDEEGNLAANIPLSCYASFSKLDSPPRQLRTFPNQLVSAGDGSFAFEIIGHQSKNEFRFEIVAKIEEIEEGYWKADKDWAQRGSWVEEKRTPAKNGSITVTGLPDKVYDNLTIILNEIGKTQLSGTVNLEEKNLDSVKIESSQFGIQLPVTKKDNYEFIINDVTAGSLYLRIFSTESVFINTPFENKKLQKYLVITKFIEIPNDTINMQIGSFELKKTAYIWGQIQNQNGDPVPDLTIYYQTTDNDIHYRNGDITDLNGYFMFDYLSPEKKYRIEAFDEDDKEILNIPPVEPNTGNLVIKIQK